MGSDMRAMPMAEELLYQKPLPSMTVRHPPLVASEARSMATSVPALLESQFWLPEERPPFVDTPPMRRNAPRR
jgi:hypothetical protein